ncbi:hypothetical protein [Streptomyces sp. URMC 123]|uniref:hypothetical protein n=1 Tax=Streptomyces sp. URMC 123 TaxID=3423403 RepID=UPI003F19BE04
MALLAVLLPVVMLGVVLALGRYEEMMLSGPGRHGRHRAPVPGGRAHTRRRPAVPCVNRGRWREVPERRRFAGSRPCAATAPRQGVLVPEETAPVVDASVSEPVPEALPEPVHGVPTSGASVRSGGGPLPADAAPVLPDAAPVASVRRVEAAPVRPEAASVLPEATPVLREAPPVLPEASPAVLSDGAPVRVR